MRIYLTIDDILKIHETVIEEFGGKSGLRDRSALESAVGRLSTGYYENIEEEASALMESLSQNHPFVDGNKRVAFFSTDIFLRMNGQFLDCENERANSFFQSLFQSNKFDFEHLLPWIRKHMKEI